MVNSVTLFSHDGQPSERFSQAPEMRKLWVFTSRKPGKSNLKHGRNSGLFYRGSTLAPSRLCISISSLKRRRSSQQRYI